jgi:hypothetical protein
VNVRENHGYVLPPQKHGCKRRFCAFAFNNFEFAFLKHHARKIIFASEIVTVKNGLQGWWGVDHGTPQREN